MTRADFYLLLDDMLELEPGTLTGEEMLEEIETWDSLAVISFIALVDEQYGTLVDTDRLANAETVDELYAIARHRKAA